MERDFSTQDAILEHVALYLGDDPAAWSWEPSGDPGDRYYFHGRLVHKDGLALFVNGHTGRSTEKVEIGPSWPRDHEGRYKSLRDLRVIPYGESEPGINVSLGRTAKALAADIRRRLIDGEDLFGKLEQVREALAELKEYDDKKTRLWKELNAIVGVKASDEGYHGRDSLSVNIYSLKDDGAGVHYGQVNVSGATACGSRLRSRATRPRRFSACWPIGSNRKLLDGNALSEVL